MRIRTRIIGAAMLVAGIANVAYTAYFIRRGRQDLVGRLNAKVADNDRLFAVVTAGPLYDGNLEQLGATLDSFFADPEILRIEIKEHRGDIHLSRERGPEAAPEGTIASRVAVTRGLDTLGEIHTTYSTTQIEERLGAMRNQLLLVSTALILGLAVVIYFVARGLTGPIDRLTAVARAMADGDLEQSLEAGGAEEVSSLSQSFLRMRDAIRSRMADLHEKNQRLSAEVAHRREAEEESARLTLIQEVTPDFVGMADPAGRVLYINKAGRAMTGVGDGDLSDLLIGQLHPQWAADRILKEGIPAAVTRGEWSGESALLSRAGSEIPVSQVILGHRDGEGRLQYISTVMRDISESRRAQAALQSSEERLRQAVRVAQIGIYDHDQRADTLYWSPQQRSVFGLGPDEPVTLQGFLERVHPDDRAIIQAAVQRAHDPAGDGSFDIEYRIVQPDGGVRWISNRGRSFFEGEGAARRPVRSVGAVIDVTSRHAAEEEQARLQAQLAHAQRLETVGRLAGGVAHDFNNMLHIILGFADLLGRNLPAEQGLSKYVAEIEHAAGRARDITRQLLAFSRKQLISPAPSNLNALVAATQKGLARLIGEDITLLFVPEEDLWAVNIDPAQVDQIVMNLAINARDAMPKGGRLTIETTNVQIDAAYCRQHVGAKEGPYVLLAVSDDGMGIDAETLAHVFEPFFTTKELGQGTGLGLATVYGIVDQNGGFVTVYSEPGRGSTFKVYLPRALESPAPAKEGPEPRLDPGGGTVLLVEDEELVRQVTTATLEAIGYRVLECSCGPEAIAYCEQPDLAIDVVLTDVVMPGMSGEELADRLTSLRPGLKVLFTSGYTSNVISHHGVLKPGVHFIPKPFGMSDLARKLREVISGP